ncbi:uncharacterized protein PRCAT00002161001 [Priceomyces carsonii]|uniref:uncharacterized protein n=1 Tax=Priceomyces carsonii TaxID=28549 RepID=UPI002ED9A2E5|nr:unnamed protein product [Priceomyces carsonii]
MTLSNIKIAVDRGGTFTDVLAIIPGQDDCVFKLLSVDPLNYKDSTIEGIRRAIEFATGVRVPKDQPLDTSCISSIRVGTTVATNALLERKGARSAFITTKGFKDMLQIGYQSRPDLFALDIVKPGVLYEKVVEINERVTLPSYTEDPDKREYYNRENEKEYTKGITGEVFQILEEIDVKSSVETLKQLKLEGIQSVAICLIHGYNYQIHEKKLKNIAEDLGFEFVTVSHELMPMIGSIPRSQSTVCDAYLTPVLKSYVRNFIGGFKKDFAEHTRIEFMRSDGGICSWNDFLGLGALLSGPAGGVVGEAQTCFDPEEKTPIVGFDMGGTSTDVSRYAGHYEHVFRTITAGIQISAPQLDINTIAAGGGSILTFEHGTLKAGPESAGAHPGPACYRKGGPLTITDANLFTGRIIPEYFPCIFGKSENEPLDYDTVETKFTELAQEINEDNPEKHLTPKEVALGFLKVANYSMAKPIRAITECRGFDVSKHNLASFGGAGGQHACSIATILKMKRVIIHRYSSILSAYGIALADVVHESQMPCLAVYSEQSKIELLEQGKKLSFSVKKKLLDQSVSEDCIELKIFFNMGYSGSSTRLMIEQPENGDFLQSFTESHLREFSFVDDKREVLVLDVRVRGCGKVSQTTARSPYKDLQVAKIKPAEGNEIAVRNILFDEGELSSKIYSLKDLSEGSVVKGPALILDTTQTILVTPNSKAIVLPNHLIIDIEEGQKENVSFDYVDPILLSVFSNRFVAIAEEMGRTLQKISVSANIKERLDFSCALFDNEGKLTANAPHVPVHLGSMSHCIRYAKRYWGEDIHPGDILASNHPCAGGTHLPDITLISPVFIDGKIQFFTASRAHHAEIGGSAPGSCAADATELFQEGAQFIAWKIVSQGKFDYNGIRKYFVEEPSLYEGCSGTRKLEDNLSDLKAQIAANQKGVNNLKELFKEYGTEVILFYMKNVNKAAEKAVRSFLSKFATENKNRLPLTAEEILDDGSTIRVKISIDERDGSVIYDFTGTSEEVYNCGNAPISITYATIIYGLRLMLNSNIPLNEGCLKPVTIIIPEGTLLNPSPFVAVSAANSTTSQRLNDTILKAFEVSGASAGSNNTLAFGKGGIENGIMKQGFAMVETIGGGSGATKNADGYSGTQCHMTNTRITDPEVLELRYPVILKEFKIRRNTGGKGMHNGGDGLVRSVQFTDDLECTIRSQRRVNAPYGIKGGKEGARGENKLGRKRSDGKIHWIHLPAFAQFKVRAGDCVTIKTPGGGGYGELRKTLDNESSFEGSKYRPVAGGTLAYLKELSNTSQ